MYARHKGWELGPVEVEVQYETPERGSPTHFELVLRLRNDLSEEQVERVRTIATKCPVHRILHGEVTFEDRIELFDPAVRAN
jgi:putative redox protein